MIKDRLWGQAEGTERSVTASEPVAEVLFSFSILIICFVPMTNDCWYGLLDNKPEGLDWTRLLLLIICKVLWEERLF